jgi:hypothetical protein
MAFNTLGLDEFLASEVKVFPNPVSSNLNIEINSNSDSIALDLYNVTGKLVLQKAMSNEAFSLNMKNLPQGIYFLQVSSSKKTGIYKIVKE